MMRNSLWLAGLAFVCACTTKSPNRVEQSVNQKTSSTLPPKVSRALSKPASPKEVDAALSRIFGAVVVAEHDDQSFVTGDFNGDGSPDLAVIVLPVKIKLRLINDDVANWTVQDADHFFTPPAGQRVLFRQKQPRPTVQAGEPLLAVIHGFGNEGWRDSAARQAYLVRHAGLGPLRAVSAPGHVENAPASINDSDVIYESSGHAGFLFWNGSQYAWSPKPNKKPGAEKSE